MSVAGKVLLYGFYRPRDRIRDSLRNGGPIAERITARNRREMTAAAERLPPLPRWPDRPPVNLHLLTGRRFWDQTIFCLHSFVRAAEVTVQAELYDDGTLESLHVEILQRLGPEVRIHRHADLRVQLDRHLPADRFPALRERWEHYPNIRRLIDVHLGGAGWKLVLDSDLLFFRRPELLLRWLAAPERPLFSIDCVESYGYSRPLMERLVGAPIPPLVNVGLCGLRSDALDWREIEAWTAELIARERTHYYLEQALVAMLAARLAPVLAPAEDYLTKPSRAEALAPRAVMHHYVDTSRRWLYRHGWRRFNADASAK